MFSLQNPLILSKSIPRACVPIVAADAAEALRQAQVIRAHDPLADLVELRADHLRDVSPAQVVALLSDMQAALVDIPILFTNRSAAEGGAWAGTEAERIALISAAIASDQLAWVDVEWATEAIARVDLLTQAETAGVDVIISAHDFGATPADSALDSVLADLISAGGDAAKLAVTAQTPDDALRLLQATARAAAAAPIPLITMAMGAVGSITRLAGPMFGSALTFATVGPSSAPGQLPLALVRDYWRAAAIRG
jgi:3-dehydroquinate dehydratase I